MVRPATEPVGTSATSGWETYMRDSGT